MMSGVKVEIIVGSFQNFLLVQKTISGVKKLGNSFTKR